MQRLCKKTSYITINLSYFHQTGVHKGEDQNGLFVRDLGIPFLSGAWRALRNMSNSECYNAFLRIFI